MSRALPVMALVLTSCGAAPQIRAMDRPGHPLTAKSGDSVMLASATAPASDAQRERSTDKPRGRMVVKSANLERVRI